MLFKKAWHYQPIASGSITCQQLSPVMGKTQRSHPNKKSPEDVALATSRGSLHRHVRELHNNGSTWEAIKTQLQGTFSDYGSSTMAGHKLQHLKQDDMPMHEYISKFTNLEEHAYGLSSHAHSSFILASTFIEGIMSPHIRNKLRSCKIQSLKDVFSQAILEDQRQKSSPAPTNNRVKQHANDFGISSNSGNNGNIQDALTAITQGLQALTNKIDRMNTTTQKSYHTNNYNKSYGYIRQHNHNKQHHSRYQHKQHNKHKQQTQIAEVEVCDCEECNHCPDDCTDCDSTPLTSNDSPNSDSKKTSSPLKVLGLRT